MIEHEILMAVSAPLLVLARPVGTLLWSLPRRARVSVGRWMRLPATDAVWGLAQRRSQRHDPARHRDLGLACAAPVRCSRLQYRAAPAAASQLLPDGRPVLVVGVPAQRTPVPPPGMSSSRCCTRSVLGALMALAPRRALPGADRRPRPSGA